MEQLAMKRIAQGHKAAHSARRISFSVYSNVKRAADTGRGRADV
jgi:hypothetical protein